MLSFPAPSVFQTAKCFFTHCKPAHIDVKQLPSKAKPWSTLQSLDFIHKVRKSRLLISWPLHRICRIPVLTLRQVDLIIPEEHAEMIHRKIIEDGGSPEFQRVTMSLLQILDRDFLQGYIKIGESIGIGC